MGVEWGTTNASRRHLSPRLTSARLVTGRAPSADLLLGQRSDGQIGALALTDLPSIEKRRRYLAALARTVTRVRLT